MYCSWISPIPVPATAPSSWNTQRAEGYPTADPCTTVAGEQGVGAEEQIAHGVAAAPGEPTLPAVLHPVVRQMTALAERAQIALCVMRRVMVAMRRRQHHPGPAQADPLDQIRRRGRPALAIAPVTVVGVLPAPVRQAGEGDAVRPAAALAAPAGTAEAHGPAERLPVGGIERAQRGADRHLSLPLLWRRGGQQRCHATARPGADRSTRRPGRRHPARRGHGVWVGRAIRLTSSE